MKKRRTCAYCKRDAEGNYSIHRDGFGVGPEVDLCDWCGSGERPSCPEIWDRIAQPSDNSWAHKKLARCEHGKLVCGQCGYGFDASTPPPIDTEAGGTER